MQREVALQTAAVSAVTGFAVRHDRHVADLRRVAVRALVRRAIRDQRATETDAEMHVKEVAEVLGAAVQGFAERARHAVYAVNYREPADPMQLIERGQIRPALEHGGADETHAADSERTRQRDAHAAYASSRARDARKIVH